MLANDPYNTLYKHAYWCLQMDVLAMKNIWDQTTFVVNPNYRVVDWMPVSACEQSVPMVILLL